MLPRSARRCNSNDSQKQKKTHHAPRPVQIENHGRARLHPSRIPIPALKAILPNLSRGQNDGLSCSVPVDAM